MTPPQARAGAAPPAEGGGDATSETRSARKRRAILDAATRMFLEKGYLGTTMDEIAALAGVSKQTVYKHFSDKERLFVEIVATTVDEAGDPLEDVAGRLAESTDLEGDLRQLAHRQIAAVTQPEVIRLRRLVIGEVGRFPELGRAFHERGAARSVASLAKAFEALGDRGLLDARDPVMAASHFNLLIVAAPVNRAMFLSDAAIPSPDELREYVREGVRVFLAAYGSRPPGPAPPA